MSSNQIISLRFENQPTKRGAIVIVNGNAKVDIASAQYELLLRLIWCRLVLPGGYATARDLDIDLDPPRIHQRVRRLRLDFDIQVYDGCGDALIENLKKCRYRLLIDINSIEISDDFERLAEQFVPFNIWSSIIDFRKPADLSVGSH